MPSADVITTERPFCGAHVRRILLQAAIVDTSAMKTETGYQYAAKRFHVAQESLKLNRPSPERSGGVR